MLLFYFFWYVWVTARGIVCVGDCEGETKELELVPTNWNFAQELGILELVSQICCPKSQLFFGIKCVK